MRNVYKYGRANLQTVICRRGSTLCLTPFEVRCLRSVMTGSCRHQLVHARLQYFNYASATAAALSSEAPTSSNEPSAGFDRGLDAMLDDESKTIIFFIRDWLGGGIGVVWCRFIR